MPQARNTPNADAAAPTGDAAAKSNESKSDRFRRIAGKRTADALKAIEKVGSTTRPSTYEYTDEQAAKIVDALDAAVKDVRESFANKGGTAASFDL